MLFVIVNWIYIFAVSFLLGTAFSRCAGRLFGWEIESVSETVFYGLIWATVYAQAFSLFHGVGVLANGILLALCAAIVLV
ncbi:MAG: hypothetical protein NC254_11160, partial [bacterium]|nr:hypothetical protein [bacterium]